MSGSSCGHCSAEEQSAGMNRGETPREHELDIMTYEHHDWLYKDMFQQEAPLSSDSQSTM
eukprot:15482-Eustigmatos_ZCMA.PRE.1